jgi:D-serine deaminase-like pyridoxal phosphate-dependent protein
MEKWVSTIDAAGIPSPALLIYPDRIEENIRRMVKMAGSPEKLRPHVKTHKMSEVVRLHLKYGISKFKCSTIAEAEMVAQCRGKDVLLAMQPVDVQIDRFFKLADHYPDTLFSILVDSPDVIKVIERKAFQYHRIAGLWLDINNGMNRTGILPGKDAVKLYREISGMTCFIMRGLHVYDGHIHDKSLNDRHVRC